LPYLKNIEKLIIKRQSYLDNISEVDKELDKVYEEISKIKDSYLNTINQIKNSMNFFDDSLDIIKIAKEEK
jgi:DNA anti-recombination protein RmuC